MLELSADMSVEREAMKDVAKIFAEVHSLSSAKLELKPVRTA